MRSVFTVPGWSRGRTLQAMAVVAVAYFVGVRIGLALTMTTQPVSTMWPPNAILLAALLLAPTQAWPLLLLAALPGHLAGELSEGIPIPMVLCWYVSNSAEALLGAGVMRALEQQPRLDTFRRVAVFLLAGVWLGPFLSSFLDAAFVSWNHFGVPSYWENWRTRFLSNALATITLVPVIVQSATARLSRIRAVSAARSVEAGLLAIGLLLVCIIIYTGTIGGRSTSVALLYLPLPFLLWAAVRFGPGGASASLLVMSLFAVWAAIHGHRPFDASSATANALAVQLFLIGTAIPLLTIGAVMSERRFGEQALRRSEERFAVAFRSSPDALLIVHRGDARVVDVNTQWEKMFGHSRAESVGRSTDDLHLFLHGVEANRFKAKLSTQDHLQEMEVLLRSNRGAVFRAVVTAQPVVMMDEPCVLVVIRDVTERRRAELELQTQRTELAHLSRVALLGELSAAFAHELNQPLAAIMANARAGQRLMARKPPDSAEVRNILEDIVADDRRAGEVIRRMQALLKRGELQLQPIDVNEVVREVVELLHSELIRREVLVHTTLAPGLARVPADRIQVQQVLMNLLFNACDAMTDQPREARSISISTSGTMGAVRISVSDQGVGIPEGKEEQVFEPFFTSKRHGLGLGLAICRTIVAAHGGRLWAVNNVDRGATFHLVLRRNGTGHESVALA
ncbi:MAG TPA: MASE1 domain-containing protein [Gemmatimonadales bacterium]|nr:MASE1 domain-containing protein [Gemmatimonadales bacterium]